MRGETATHRNEPAIAAGSAEPLISEGRYKRSQPVLPWAHVRINKNQNLAALIDLRKRRAQVVNLLAALCGRPGNQNGTGNLLSLFFADELDYSHSRILFVVGNEKNLVLRIGLLEQRREICFQSSFVAPAGNDHGREGSVDSERFCEFGLDVSSKLTFAKQREDD